MNATSASSLPAVPRAKTARFACCRATGFVAYCNLSIIPSAKTDVDPHDGGTRAV